MIYVIVIFPSARHKLGFTISFILASIMCLKSGANLNYYLFPFYILTVFNRVSLKKVLVVSLLCHGYLLTELYDRIDSHRTVIEFVHRENISSLTFGPSYLLGYVEIDKPDAHIWRTRNNSLPPCGSAIISEDSDVFMKEVHHQGIKNYRLRNGFYWIKWGNHEAC